MRDIDTFVKKQAEREMKKSSQSISSQVLDIPSSARTVKRSIPNINSVELRNSSPYKYGRGAKIEVIVRLSEPVTVKGAPDNKPTLQIEFKSGVTREAEYTDGSGTAELLFCYIVENGDNSNKVSLPEGIINPNGCTVTNLSGVPIRLQHPPSAPPNPVLSVTDKFEDERVSEIVFDLSNSRSPTLVVEGKNDAKIYRWLVDHLGQPLVVTAEAGGKPNLLEIYRRRKEFYSVVPVAFLADLDRSVFTTPEMGYPDIIWTAGYSIENDLYLDSKPERFLNLVQNPQYNKLLNEKISEFAKEVAEKFASDPKENRSQDTLKAVYTREISLDPACILKGKELFEVLKEFCPREAIPRRYSDTRLYDWLFTIGKGTGFPKLSRLIEEIHDEIERIKAGMPTERKDKLLQKPRILRR